MSREQIKAVSLSLFAQHGYAETSLSDIARQVGLQKSSLYAHIESKEELFLEVFKDVMDAYVEHLAALTKTIEAASVEQKLYQMLHGTCTYYKNNEEHAALLKRAMLFPPAALKDKLQAQFLRSEEETTRILMAIFSEGLQNGTLRPARLEDLLASFYCLSDGLFVQLFYYEPEHFMERLESAWHIYWVGISSEHS
ncbi:TetR/AcrR family transcriptional regulator [Ktedonosporobacter rubrisoli]|uniref:TetR/AcrR family transcriptional regulator n=1 Tax=Ktedonosporobacter rubrisoli TaxID=2509675 RepID=A0A4P6JI59_KTERU|nr:TetR/AcrR family transcriptional regulator [Ktedonosporobacter rubrisoli]QBD74739.1 TetR/AcrR family transcriptional regulator [Ktedonosporobacter rubrisoli]